MKKQITTRIAMRKTSQNISLILLCTFLLLANSCVDHYSRIEIKNLTLGDNLTGRQFTVLNDYKELDFPYREVILENDSNVVIKIVGENNTIFEIKTSNLSSRERKELIRSITDKLGVEADSSKNEVVSNMWRCNMYIWKDPRSYDLITLSSCVYKNEKTNLEKRWELKIVNDTIQNILDEKYNRYH